MVKVEWVAKDDSFRVVEYYGLMISLLDDERYLALDESVITNEYAVYAYKFMPVFSKSGAKIATSAKLYDAHYPHPTDKAYRYIGSIRSSQPLDVEKSLIKFDK